MLNDDTEILTADWLDIIKANASRPEVGAVGAKLLYPDDTIQHAGVILGVGGVAGHGFKRLTKNTNVQFNRANLPHYVSAVTAAFLCIRREVYNEVGGLDGENLRIAFNDIDFCLKVGERGYHNLYLPEIVLRHYESYSRGMEDTLEKQARFAKEVRFMRDKWGSLLDNDPYYSPNLSLHSEQFHIRTVPGNAYQPV
jgi:GT2 family glycosyltransferase